MVFGEYLLMKILIILNKNEVTGPNIVAINTAKALAKKGNNIFVVFLRKANNSKQSNDIPNTVTVKQLDGGMIKVYFSLKEVINSFKPDVIHSHCLLPDFYNAISARKLARVNTIHNIASEDYSLRYGSLKGSLLYFLHLLINNLINRNICVSKTVCKRTFRFTSNNKRVIYNSVDKVFYNDSSAPKQIITIVYCGHFSNLKNPLSIINALLNINVPFKFMGLGDGEQLDECINLTKTDKRFEFFGRVTNVHEYLNKSHCLIHFSKTEGFCLAIAEALVSRMSVISNDLPVIREFKNSFSADNIYICKDQNTLVTDLEVALEDIYTKISRDDFNSVIAEKVKEATDVDLLATKHLRIYQEVNAQTVL